MVVFESDQQDIEHPEHPVYVIALDSGSFDSSVLIVMWLNIKRDS